MFWILMENFAIKGMITCWISVNKIKFKRYKLIWVLLKFCLGFEVFSLVLKLEPMTWAYLGTWNFGMRHFCMDISQWGIFCMSTLWYGYFSAPWMFQHGYITVLGHSATGVPMSKSRCWNVYLYCLHSTKKCTCCLCTWAEMSRVPK